MVEEGQNILGYTAKQLHLNKSFSLIISLKIFCRIIFDKDELIPVGYVVKKYCIWFGFVAMVAACV